MVNEKWYNFASHSLKGYIVYSCHGSYCSLLFEAYKLVYFLLFLPAQFTLTSFSYMQVVHFIFLLLNINKVYLLFVVVRESWLLVRVDAVLQIINGRDFSF